MKIYTSYFANWRYFPKDIKQISIAKFPPKGFKGDTFTCLSPSNALLYGYKNGSISEQSYVIEFKEYLSKLNFRKVLNDLKSLSGDKDCILLCYEKPTDFCHRHLVAEWLKENGAIVEELKV